MGNNSSSFKSEVTVMKGHSSSVNCLLLVEEPFNMILTGSNDRTIRIWSRKTLKCVNVIKKHSLSVFSLLRFDHSVFLSCSDDTSIASFTLLETEPYFEFKKEFTMNNSPVYGLLKLSKTEFLSTSRTNEFMVINHEQNQLVRKLQTEGLVGSTKPIMSKTNPKCFFSITTEHTVRKVDWEKDIVIAEYTKHNFLRKSKILSICSFIRSSDEKKDEFLVCGGSPFHNISYLHTGLVYVYNTSIEESQKCLVTNKTLKHAVKSLYANEKYICCGGFQKGIFCMIDIFHQEEENSLVIENEIHKSFINELFLIENELENTLVLFSCSKDKLIKKMVIKGLTKV